MLKKSILTGLAAAALAAGISFAAPVAASAGNLNIELRHHNGHGSIYIGKRKRHSNYHRPRRHKVCHPGRAIHKVAHTFFFVIAF